MSLFQSSPKEVVNVVFNIGSGSIGGAIVVFSEGKIPSTIYSFHESFGFSGFSETKKVVPILTASLRRVSDKIFTEGVRHLSFTKIKNKKISKTYCFLSSPWIVSKTKIIKISKEKSFLIDENLLAEQINFEKEKFNKDVLSGKVFGSSNEKIDLVEGVITHVKLNGYSSPNPYGKKVNSAEFSILMSFVPSEIVFAIKNVMHDFISHGKVVIHSSSLALFSSLRNLYPEQSFLCVSVGGEITDVFMVKRGALVDVASFPIGINSLTKKVSSNGGMGKKVSDSALSLYASKKTNQVLTEKLKSACDTYKNEWVNMINKTLLEFAEDASIPLTAYVLSDEKMEDYFVSCLNSVQFRQLALSNESFVVKKIDKNAVEKMCKTINEEFYNNELSILASFIYNLNIHAEPLISQ